MGTTLKVAVVVKTAGSLVSTVLVTPKGKAVWAGGWHSASNKKAAIAEARNVADVNGAVVVPLPVTVNPLWVLGTPAPALAEAA